MLGIAVASAQVTTSGLNGTIKDATQGLPGATVKATHLPSGTVYGTTTQPDGRYTIPNMRAGGPYRVEVSFIGYSAQTFNDIQLKLGVFYKLDATLESGSQQLQEVTVSGQRGGIINPNNSGTAVNISRTQIENLPTVTRSVQDFARLSAQASTYTSGSDGSPLGISFGGQNNRYNQFAVDGAMANDVFGLAASGTNGGQASGNPISIEAIEQIQIVLNPYDVKQSGFAGGGINAITKSGTNDFHGAAYFLYQNRNFVGESPNAAKLKYGKFSSNTYGIGLGGPIIKNKLFFYLNAERVERTSPIDFNPADPGTGTTNYTETQLKAISDKVKNTWGVDLGGYTAQEREFSNTNILGRIDWNISNVHKLTLRHSYSEASNVAGTSRARDNAFFYNSYYSFPSKTNSTTLELNSIFSNRLSNELRIGLNIVRDNRKYNGDPFTNVRINDPGTTYNVGSEFSSQVNALKQNIITITDNVTLYRGKHTITIGTSNDIYNMKNDFMQGAFGAYTFGSLNDFLNDGKPTQYQITYTTNDTLARDGVTFKAAQLGLYAQDEWDVAPNFRLTYGLRVDMPIFPTDPSKNETFAKEFPGYSTDVLPKSKLLWAPRVGFNWDVMNNGKTQIRGGVGIFTSRVPFVWISNQYNNTGNLYTVVNLNNAALPASFRMRFDKNDPFYGQYSVKNLQALGITVSQRASAINLTDENFKFPQTFKTNLALDQQLPWGVIGTLELNYSKTINNVIWTNLATELTGNTMTLGGQDTRPTWRKKTTPSGFEQVLLLENTSEGYTYNLSAEFTKTTSNGLFAKVGYSFGEAKSLNDGTSSTANSNWRFPPNVNGLNNLDLGYSKYRMGHRVFGAVTKAFRYGKQKQWATSVGLFYNGQSGTPYTWVYFNTVDPTGDDLGSSGNNDLVYIPTAAEVSTMRFDVITKRNAITGAVEYTRSEAEQRTDLEELIKSDKYLNSHRGQRADKYAVRTPFEHVFDFKLVQTIPIIKSHKVDITFDIMNVGNLLNNKWGRSYFITNNVATPITFRNNNAGPVFQYDKTRLNDTDGKMTPYFTNNFTARWRGQLGVRYSF
ncbi:TonB-dependent receptor [Chitinophaga sp. 22620]|uniref:TonB-dependent receptor n=1 Tax=Chitinophaga sp. 22620 TaxID=3453952 RepID=UPI003F85B87D